MSAVDPDAEIAGLRRGLWSGAVVTTLAYVAIACWFAWQYWGR